MTDRNFQCQYISLDTESEENPDQDQWMERQNLGGKRERPLMTGLLMKTEKVAESRTRQ